MGIDKTDKEAIQFRLVCILTFLEKKVIVHSTRVNFAH